MHLSNMIMEKWAYMFQSTDWISFQVHDVKQFFLTFCQPDVAYHGVSNGKNCPDVGLVRFAKHAK